MARWHRTAWGIDCKRHTRAHTRAFSKVACTQVRPTFAARPIRYLGQTGGDGVPAGGVAQARPFSRPLCEWGEDPMLLLQKRPGYAS